MVVVALEKALGFAAGEVIAVQEGMVAFGAGAEPAEENIVAVLQDDAAAGGKGFQHGRAGILVAVLGVAAPHQLGRLGGVVKFDLEGAHAARLALGIFHKGAPAFFEELDAAEALLGPDRKSVM